MSHEIQNLRKRLTTVMYEAAQEDDKILFLQESLESRLASKELSLKNNWKWENVYQMGLEQNELEIKIRQAAKDKLINEAKFLRLMIQEAKEKLTHK